MSVILPGLPVLHWDRISFNAFLDGTLGAIPTQRDVGGVVVDERKEEEEEEEDEEEDELEIVSKEEEEEEEEVIFFVNFIFFLTLEFVFF